MSLPDYKRAMARYAEAPVLDDTTGAFDGKVRRILHGTNKTAAQVLVAGYFNFNRDNLRVGDIIDVVCDVDGTPDLLTLRVATVPAAPSNVTVIADPAGYAAAAPANVTIALAASATTDGMDATITVVDENGNAIADVFALEAWISEDAAGLGLTADSTGTLTVPDGALLTEFTDDKHVSLLTEATGIATLLLVDSNNPADQYVCVKHPVTGQVIVSAISGTNWEGV